MHFNIQDSTIEFRKNQFSRLSVYSYAADWAFYIAILVGFIVYSVFVPPRALEFSTQDISLMHSYKEEDDTAIPLLTLVIIAVVFPIIQFFLCSIFSRGSLTGFRRAWDIFVGLMCLCGGMSTQLMVIVILKNICGLPRPDLLARCAPDLSLVAGPTSLFAISICETENIQLLHEGFRSFPSGHSSTVFRGMVISSMNISGKLQVFDKRGISFKVLLAIFPVMVACFVACTRISDNRHFLRDVVGGSIIGSSIGIWFYSQYFPSIFNLENGGRAYPPRRIGVSKCFNNVGGFWKITEYLPGSFQQRNLNSSVAVCLLNQYVPSFENHNTEELTEIDVNIKVVNQLTKDMGNTYVDILNPS